MDDRKQMRFIKAILVNCSRNGLTKG